MPESLYHHGILGMKWGRRRTPEELGHIKKKDFPRNVNDVSTEDLKKLTARLNAEENYYVALEKHNARNQSKFNAILTKAIDKLGNTLVEKGLSMMTDKMLKKDNKNKEDQTKKKQKKTNQPQQETKAEQKKTNQPQQETKEERKRREKFMQEELEARREIFRLQQAANYFSSSSSESVLDSSKGRPKVD